jgi:alkylated DNA repair dioxygenase AlkB
MFVTLVPMVQDTLFSVGEEVELRPIADGLVRTTLGRGAWLDFRPGWVAGAGELFGRLERSVPWRAERRPMYERIVDVPRLVCFYEDCAAVPDASVEEMRRALSSYYERSLGEPLETVGMCLYRDGNDSVAWHGDRVGRSSHEDTVVAIVSLGATRRFLLRPRGAGPAFRIDVATGDLLVMGGSCQRTWDHAVSKSRRPVGPRISLQFRTRGVR